MYLFSVNFEIISKASQVFLLQTYTIINNFSDEI